MNEFFDTPWSGVYFVVLEVVTLWHAWTWAKSQNSENFWDLFLGRFALCQFAAMGFYLILNYSTKVMMGLLNWMVI